MVGAALVRPLDREGCEVLTVGRAEVDLTRQDQVEGWIANAKPQAIFLGGECRRNRRKRYVSGGISSRSLGPP